MSGSEEFSVAISLLAGGAAGTSVDILLFPLDTIRTRLQSQKGFWSSGGFRGIYSGLLSASVGSAPTASLFFLTYDFVKRYFQSNVDSGLAPIGHMTAASLGEVAACLIRVPVEVIKQRSQTLPHLTSGTIVKNTFKSEGIPGFYRGYLSTITREIPFSLIQFPLWEYFKFSWSKWENKDVDPWQSSICGALAGGIAAALTTPLDVAKTRIMLAKHGSSLATGQIMSALKVIYKENGFSGLFAGIVPRVLWISIGGAMFLGIYDKVKVLASQLLNSERTDS